MNPLLNIKTFLKKTNLFKPVITIPKKTSSNTLDLNKAINSGGLSIKPKTTIPKITIDNSRALNVKKAVNSGGLTVGGVNASAAPVGAKSITDNVKSGGLTINQNAISAFEKTKEEFKQKAIKNAESMAVSNSWFFGATRQQQKAREYSRERSLELQGNIDKYDARKEQFEKDRAKRQADFAKAQETMSRDELIKLSQANAAWEQEQVNSLNYTAASLSGLLEGYGLKASSELTTTSADIGRWFQNNVQKPVTNSSIWKYTLGEGGDNVPSVVTAPNRFINFWGNLIGDENRQINLHDNQTTTLKESGKNSWQATKNQRSWNKETYQKEDFDAGQAFVELRDVGSIDKPSVQQVVLQGKFARAKTNDEKLAIAKEYWNERERARSNEDKLLEFARDPVMWTGAVGKLGKLEKVGKWGEAIKTSKPATWLGKAKTAVTENKAFKWLGKEYKTPEEVLDDVVKVGRKDIDALQSDLLPKIVKARKELDSIGVDTSVFDDLLKLDDYTAGIIQRSSNGKIARLDALKLAGKKQYREQVENLIAKIENFSEEMRKADAITNTRFGKSVKGRFYSPTPMRDVKTGDLSGWNFRAFKKGQSRKSAQKLRQDFIDRYFVSGLDDVKAAAKSSKSNELKSLTGKYDTAMDEIYAGIDAAKAKTTGKLNKVRKTLSAPRRVWKKSVLKYRPAWTVNNVAYNVPAATMAGGKKALIEHAKMLKPSYYRKVLNEVPEAVRSNLAKEIGSSGKLDKFYNNVENWSRLAGYKGALSKGYTPEQALKRVNKYLFDYKITNAERPLKAIVPFYSFQKNLARAATTLSIDQPVAAKLYNTLGNVQQKQFSEHFDKTVKQELLDMGYTEEDVVKIKDEMAKYYKGRLKIGDKFYNTPFNAFSEKGLSSTGIDPFIQSWIEHSTSKDSFGRELKGVDSSLRARVINKFPQADMVYQGTKPKEVERWIGKTGSSGFGLTKESEKTSYSVKDSLWSFLGKPKGIEFDPSKTIERKKMQKVKDEYFALNSDMSYEERQKAQDAIFAKYGITRDDFYKGELSKYDTQSTKDTKILKEQARLLNDALFDEYQKQPRGTRNAWATAKLKELNDSGYFDRNPYLVGFDWISSESFTKAERQKAYKEAKRTGNWSYFTKGKLTKNNVSTKRVDYNKAKNSGDWSTYNKKYGDNRSAEAKFWAEYVKASTAERKQMIADNPQYAKRKDWTNADWDKWKAAKKAKEKKQLATIDGFIGKVSNYRKANAWKAATFNNRARRQRKVLLKMRG